MGLIIIWLIIGGAGGAAVGSFLDNRGSSSLGLPLSVVAGIVGAFVGGFLFIQFATSIFGEGLVQIVSFAAAGVAAFLAVLLARAIKK